MKKLVAASGNKNKIIEIKAILSPYFDEIVSASEAGFKGDIDENGKTFFENAFIKAKTVAEPVNCAALADDSGLCVDALGGMPGIFSARYCGMHGSDLQNNLKLLKDMEKITDRSCRFVSSVVLYFPGGKYISGEGFTEGILLRDFEGNNGFGYDSLFFSSELKKSFGNASDDEKNSISHRYKALMDLVKKL